MQPIRAEFENFRPPRRRKNYTRHAERALMREFLVTPSGLLDVCKQHRAGHAVRCRCSPTCGSDSESASGSGFPFVSGRKGTAISPRM